jgi:hypothetical protein
MRRGVRHPRARTWFPIEDPVASTYQLTILSIATLALRGAGHGWRVEANAPLDAIRCHTRPCLGGACLDGCITGLFSLHHDFCWAGPPRDCLAGRVDGKGKSRIGRSLMELILQRQYHRLLWPEVCLVIRLFPRTQYARLFEARASTPGQISVSYLNSLISIKTISITNLTDLAIQMKSCLLARSRTSAKLADGLSQKRRRQVDDEKVQQRSF